MPGCWPSHQCSRLLRMQARYFEDEIRPHLKHKHKGLLGMAGAELAVDSRQSMQRCAC